MRTTRLIASLVLGACVILGGAVSAHADEATATLHGSVVGPGSAPPLKTDVRVHAADDSIVASAAVVDGLYTITDIPPGTYNVRFTYVGAENYVGTWAGGAYERSGAIPVVLGAGDSVEVNGEIRAGASITGHVSPENIGATAGNFRALRSPRADGATSPMIRFDNATSTYSITKLIPGDYTVWATRNGFQYVFLNDVVRIEDAEWVSLSEGETVVRDIALDSRSLVVGTVRSAPDDAPLAGVPVSLITRDGIVAVSTTTSAAGTYEMRMAPGTYIACFGEVVGAGGVKFAESCARTNPFAHWTTGYAGSSDRVDAHLEPGGRLTVTPTTEAPSGSVLDVSWMKQTDEGDYVEYAHSTAAPGTPVSSPTLPPGRYVVRVLDASLQYAPEFAPNASLLRDAVSRVVTAGSATDIGTVALPPWGVEAQRLSGADRFETAVAATRTAFPGADLNLPVLYLVNGYSFADALSAGPMAALDGGALLPVLPDSVPEVVLDEIERLNPTRIVIVGGRQAVSQDVYDAMIPLVETPLYVTRQGGENRYETAYYLASHRGWPDSGVVFVATGENYPDALAAGPAAAAARSTVVLVNGTGHLTTWATAILAQVGADTIVVLGGTSAVSATVRAELDALSGASVVRVAGDDRYDTALKLNQQFGPDTDTAFIASGGGFVDALSGGAAAAHMGAALYLSEDSCLSSGVADQLAADRVRDVLLLGGPARLSNEVLALDRC